MYGALHVRRALALTPSQTVDRAFDAPAHSIKASGCLLSARCRRAAHALSINGCARCQQTDERRARPYRAIAAASLPHSKRARRGRTRWLPLVSKTVEQPRVHGGAAASGHRHWAYGCILTSALRRSKPCLVELGATPSAPVSRSICVLFFAEVRGCRDQTDSGCSLAADPYGISASRD